MPGEKGGTAWRTSGESAGCPDAPSCTPSARQGREKNRPAAPPDAPAPGTVAILPLWEPPDTQGLPVTPPVYQHTFPNGLTLLAEPMDYVRSATAYVLLP